MADRFLIPDLVKIPHGIPVPENMKKKADKVEEMRKEKEAAKLQLSIEKKQRRVELRQRTLGYEKEYADEEKALIAARAQARKENGFFREPEPRVMFVIRLKGINKLAPKPKKVLQLFRLLQIHNGVFLKVNKATLEMLKMVHPFVTFGYPSLKTVRELLLKRGYAKTKSHPVGDRKRIMDNDIIHEKLGQYGIHGLEDLVHEIYTCGPHFKQANNFLWRFKLSTPVGGWIAKRRGYCDPRGGDWGNREDKINELIHKMN